LKSLLLDKLYDVHLDPDLAIKPNPMLKDQQVAAMSNGDVFVPEPPPFEIYQTKISYGWDKERVKMDVLGIKCSVEKTRLLKEFFSQKVPMELETLTSKVIPTSAVHILGTDKYLNLLWDNISFLQSVTMVPLRDFQHETLEIPFSMDKNTDIEQTNLNSLITSQQWCIDLEKTATPSKVLLVTMKGQLTAARKWVTCYWVFTSSTSLIKNWCCNP